MVVESHILDADSCVWLVVGGAVCEQVRVLLFLRMGEKVDFAGLDGCSFLPAALLVVTSLMFPPTYDG